MVTIYNIDPYRYSYVEWSTREIRDRPIPLNINMMNNIGYIMQVRTIFILKNVSDRL